MAGRALCELCPKRRISGADGQVPYRLAWEVRHLLATQCGKCRICSLPLLVLYEPKAAQSLTLDYMLSGRPQGLLHF